MLPALFLERGRKHLLCPNWHVRSCFAAMGAFLFSCLCSYFASGMSTAVLLGNQGRYCGLLFFLCCGVAFYIICVIIISQSITQPDRRPAGPER